MILRILSVALAAWLGGGAIAYGVGHARYGLTPSVSWLFVALIAAVAVRRSLVGVMALVLLLPWVPLRLPAAALIWTGHAASWVLVMILAAIAADWARSGAPRVLRNALIDPQRAPRAAFVLCALLSVTAAWAAAPRLPQGDEPHYLVIAQSLLTDHDLQIENNYQRGDYHDYFAGDLRPDYLRRGTDGQIYSVHAPGLPAIVAPAFALFGYPGVVVFLALVAAAAGSLAWSSAWRITGNPAAAWFGWAVVALTEPFFAQSFMVYPEVLAAGIVMFAVATMLLGRDASLRRLALAGGALALLPWLHTRAVVLAAALGAALAVRQSGSATGKRIAALAAAPLVSAIAWFAFFYAIYGTPDPRAPYGAARQLAAASMPTGIVGLLFDQQFGILPSAPVYLLAALGFWPLAQRDRRLSLELILALAPYALTVAAFPMWWAGYTTPARFLVPMLLPLAIPAAAAFDAVRRPSSRLLALALLALSITITFTVVLVDRGALLLNFRDGAARLLVWLSAVVDLTRAVPSLFQNPARSVVFQSVAWLVAAAMVAGVSRLRAVQTLDRGRQRVALGGAAVAATMLAATVVWWTNGKSVASDGGALAFLAKYDGDARQLGLSLSPFRRVRRADVPPRLLLVDGAPQDDEPLAALRNVPAATYVVELTLARAAGGTLTASLDRTLGPMWRFDVGGAIGSWRHELVVPVASPALLIDGDPALRAAIDRVTVRATAIPGSSHRIADGQATHAGRYGSVLLFLFDEHAFVEPTGVWVEGASSADFALVADDRRPVRLLVRTPPVANLVTFDGSGWHQEVPLAAGESKVVDVPTSRMRVTVRNGARPVDFETGSDDIRFLGVWLEPR